MPPREAFRPRQELIIYISWRLDFGYANKVNKMTVKMNGFNLF